MRAKLFMALMTFCLVFAASCDSSTTPKYLEFATDMLLPQATIDKSYDFTFIVTYGGDRWDENTGFVDSDIIWGFDSWKLNSLDQTEGPVNLIFADGKITGTPTAAESGLWSFNATIQKGKKTVIETFFLPIAQNIEITTDSQLPYAVSETSYQFYFSATYGTTPYYWSFGNWTKDGNPVNDAPVGFTLSGSGYIGGLAAHSEAGDWTFDVTVFDTSVPTQLTTTKNFALTINLKLLVPTNYATIQAAVDIANNGETVYLEAGTYQGNGNRDVEFGGKTLTIIGDPVDPSQVVIDCEGTSSDPHRAFYFGSGEQDCVIDGVTIKNGHASVISSHFRGGAIYMGDYIGLTVQNCIFEDNKTVSLVEYIYGGAIYVENYSDLVVENTTFINTETTTAYGDIIYGGSIYVTSQSSLKMEDVEFKETKSHSGYYSYGGEIYMTTVGFDFKNVTFTNGSYKGGYYYFRGLFYFSSCNGKFDNVDVLNCKMELRSTSTAYFYGGIAYFTSCNITFNDCEFSNNVMEFMGTYSQFYFYGMLYMSSGSSKWENCIIANNILKESTRTAYLYGGIYYMSSHQSKFYSCHFLMNELNTRYGTTSYSYGGGVRIYSNCTVVFNDCVFAYNTAECGAAAISAQYSTANVTINNTTFYKNEGYAGGAIYSYSQSLTVNNSILWDNSATNNGNQIYCYSNGRAILNNTLYRNQPGDIYGSITPTSCINTDPYFKDTGTPGITGDCTFTADTMTVTGTPGTSVFLTEIMRGDMIYLTADGDTKCIAVVEVVSDTELKVAGYYTGTPGTGAATVKKMDFTPQHTSDGDANDSPCVDSGDNTKVKTAADIAGNTRIVDGNSNATATVDMGAYEKQ